MSNFKFNDEVLNHYEFIKAVCSRNLDTVTTNKKIEYYNIACAFDIETSSFYYNEEKCAIMYVWQLCVDGLITMGRTWEEFVTLIDELAVKLNCLPQRRHLVIYVHNLSYEFQFMRKWFDWDRVFSLSKRKPVQALTINGIEFRCSYILSGYSLEKVGEELQKYKENKKVGQLDYSLLRTSKTELTQEELEYCIYDVRVVTAYIQEKIENEGNITRIPLTKTGYVRNYCRKKCLYKQKSRRLEQNEYYLKLMKLLTLEPDEYIYLNQAFQGGFTHANYNYIPKKHKDIVVKNVTSKDFTSSYPAVILSEMFPMSKGTKFYPRTEKVFREYLKKYCCVFSITMHGISQKANVYENPISSSRCIFRSETGEILSKDVHENNGRVYYAEQISMVITEIDFDIYERFYDIESIDYDNIVMYYYEKAYLPKPIIESVLDFYETKTTLKDVEGKEVEYMAGKANLNSIYGMMVTNICRDEIIYEGDTWGSEKQDIDEEITRYNKSRKRFLFYPWGIYITAYARRNLFSGIYELGKDYVYSDTDSVKYINPEKHVDYFNRYNNWIISKISRCLEHYDINVNRAKPKTIKGEEKPIGVWDDDGEYTRFKTLGAKRYLVEYEKGGKLVHKLTVAGLGKTAGVNFLEENYSDVFEGFHDNMRIPANKTNKNTHTYLDWDECPAEGLVKDYKGVSYHFYEKSAIHLEACPFDLSLSEKYAEFLLNIVESEDY